MTEPVTIDGKPFFAEAADVWILHGMDSGMGNHVRELRHLVRTALTVHHLVYSLRNWVKCPTNVVHTSTAWPPLWSSWL